MVLVYNMNMNFALRIIIKICAMPYGLATKDLKIRCEGEDAMMQNVNQSHMTILSCIVLYTVVDQRKQNTSDHLLPHALPLLRLTRAILCRCEFLWTWQLECLTAQNAIKQVMKKQACAS